MQADQPLTPATTMCRPIASITLRLIHHRNDAVAVTAAANQGESPETTTPTLIVNCEVDTTVNDQAIALDPVARDHAITEATRMSIDRSDITEVIPETVTRLAIKILINYKLMEQRTRVYLNINASYKTG